MLKPVSSIGPELDHLEADRNIPSDPLDYRKRRTIRLMKKNESWGFTIQTYGFKNKKTGEIEVYTYVDYVDLNGPASIAGMRRGDIILSVNGKSVEFATHQELVSVIQSCKEEARMVVLFVDCCKKVELHDRLIKLKKLLSDKIKELRNVEMKERELLDGLCTMRGLERFDHSRQSIYSNRSSDSSLDRISILTLNSSTIYNLPNTVTLHLNTSNSSSPTSKSFSDDQSDCTDDGEMFADVSFADDSDGDSGYSYDEVPHLERKNTVIEREKPFVEVRERRGTLVAPVCECIEDSICQFCKVREISESSMTLADDSDVSTPVQDTTSCLDSICIQNINSSSKSDPEEISEANEVEGCSHESDERDEMTPTNSDQICASNRLEQCSAKPDLDNENLSLSNPDELEQSSCNTSTNENLTSLNPDQIHGSDVPEQSNDSEHVAETDGACCLPAGQVEQQESPNAESEETPDDATWDFPFWTEGAVVINLDDEKTKL